MFQGLSVAVDSSTADFRAGMASAKESASGLSLSLRRLGRSADEAEEELDSAGRSATTTAGMFSALSLSTDGLSASFGTLSATTTVTLIPALATLSTMLIPLVATLGGVAAAATGLAGAFGLVVGSGLIAFGQQRGEQNRQRLQEIRARIDQLERIRDIHGSLSSAQQDRLQQLEEEANTLEEQTGVLGGLQSAFGDLLDQIRPMIVAFGQEFVPLIEDAFEAIPELVENILDAVGGLDVFKEALRDAGESAMEAIPNVVATLMDLAREALPALRDGAVWLLENGPDIFRGMMDTTREVLPLLQDLVRAFIDAAPTLNRFGTAMIRYVVPGITTVTNAIGGLVEWWNNLDGTLKTAIIISVGAAIAALGSGITAAVAAVIAAVEIWKVAESVLGSLGDTVSNVLSGVAGIPGAIRDGLNQAWKWLKNEGADLLASAFAWLTDAEEGLPSLVLEGLSDGINGLIDWLAEGAKEVFAKIKDFVKRAVVAGATLGLSEVEFDNAGSTVPSPDNDVVLDRINEQYGQNFESVEELRAAAESGDIPITPSTIDRLTSSHTGSLVESSGLLNVESGQRVVPAAQVTDRGGVEVNGGASAREIASALSGLTVLVRTGDETLDRIIDEKAEVVVENKSKQWNDEANRLGGRSG